MRLLFVVFILVVSCKHTEPQTRSAKDQELIGKLTKDVDSLENVLVDCGAELEEMRVKNLGILSKYQFDELSLDKMLEITIEDGHFITERDFHGDRIMTYALYKFYVIILYDTEKKGVQYIESSNSSGTFTAKGEIILQDAKVIRTI